MSAGKKWVSAEALLTELENDPAFVRQREERERAHQERVDARAKVLEPILADLRAAGLQVQSWNDLLPRYAPLPLEAIGILLGWLPRIEDESDVEVVVRAIGGTVAPYEGAPLVKVFESARSDGLRWAVANTIAVSNPTGISEWVLHATADPQSGKAREMLAMAAARLASPDAANRLLLALLPELPIPTVKALAVSGGEHEVAVLEKLRDETKGWQRKEVEKAIRTIRKRLDGR